jgi:DNA-binding HxlR family transcriptional regulator
MPQTFRCDCPITSALDVLGDKWMLVLVKQMLLEGRHTFKDFTTSDEGIATNILTTKLKLLEEVGLVTKSKLPHNKKTNFYHLTEQGLALTPIIVELALWSDAHLRELNPAMRAEEGLDMMKADREAFIQALQQQYRERVAARLAENPEN